MNAPQNQPATRQFRVTLAGQPINFGGLGRVGTGWESGIIDAATSFDAIVAAREQCAEKFDSGYAKGRATVVEIHTYQVTLRGRKDKRRRETFIARGENEKAALRMLSYNPAASRFADIYSRRGRESAVVKVEQVR